MAINAVGGYGRALPLAHRLALAYLLLPVLAWLLGWFRWWIGGPLAALLLACALPLLAGPWRRPRPVVWGLLALALGWTWLTAAGGRFDAFNGDWPNHRAILLDLGRYAWPAFLSDPLRAYLEPETLPAPPLLRYYLGWYLLPGLAARLGGPGALQWAVPLWTALGVALLLRLATQGCRGRRVLLAGALFMGFGGMDVLRLAWPAVSPCPDLRLDRLSWSSLEAQCFLHLEWWPNSSNQFHYASSMAALMWGPQHFLPAGLGALLLWRLRRRPRFLAASGVVLAASLFWSPFVTVGLLPFAALLVRINGLRPFLRWPNLGLAPLLAGLTLLYLTAGAVDFFEYGWLWTRYAWSQLAREVPLVYLLEFLAAALLLVGARPALRREAFFLTSVAVLLALPWYFYHVTLQARVSSPALVMLACRCARVASARGLGRASRRRWAWVGLACVLGVGVLTGAVEATRAVRNVRPFRYAVAADHARSTNLELSRASWRENLAFAPSPLLRRLLREPPPRPEPAVLPPLVRGAVDLHWVGRGLTYVQTDCPPAARELFLQVQPAHFADYEPAQQTYRLGLGLGAPGYDWSVDYAGYGLRAGRACAWRWTPPLFAFEVASLRTGQAGQWEAELRLDTTGKLIGVTHRDAPALHATYRALTTATRLATAPFDVRLTPDGLALTRAGCTAAATAASFFLHVVPFETVVLPPERRGYGFAVRNFPFAAVGSRVDDLCWLTLPLPAYGIRTLRVGQFAAGRELWRVDVPFAERVPAALDALRGAYRAVAAQEPAARAAFDVHIAQDSVLFVKAPCAAADTDAKFTLHVVPVRRRHLPPDRRRAGFANLDFPLEGHGAHFDGVCLARQSLPAYPIARLRVGQFLSREQRSLWQEEIPIASR